jgi:hypothetical protein
MKLLALGVLMATTSATLHGAKIELPDVLTTQSGQKVTTSQQWTTQRRPEVLELFASTFMAALRWAARYVEV